MYFAKFFTYEVTVKSQAETRHRIIEESPSPRTRTSEQLRASIRYSTNQAAFTERRDRLNPSAMLLENYPRNFQFRKNLEQMC